MLRKTIKVLFTMILGFGLLGCSNSTNGNQNSSSNKTASTIEDIEWSVKESMVDGEIYVLLDFINNSDYTITGLSMNFKERDDITEEEKDSFYTDIKELTSATEDEMKELKELPLGMHAESKFIVDPGKEATNANLYYYEGFFYVKNIEHYNLMQPESITIHYIDDDMINTVYYEFEDNKYLIDESKIEAYQWAQGDFKDLLPKPKVQVLESNYETEDSFSFVAYGVNEELFNSYIESCKEFGYKENINVIEDYYSASDSNGYNIDISFDSKKLTMNVSIDKQTNE